ncbi:MAG: hypothetical protein IT242_09225 [Bacteroidia bacterium]|nr:hypothetical protein [Bacteroidia bacterium]
MNLISMKALWYRIIRKKMYESIPYEDLMSRQRFSLFRIYSFTSFLASIFTALQIDAVFSFSFLPEILTVLGTVIIVNFYIVKDYHKIPAAYIIGVLAGFTVLHIQAYNAGGVLNTGTMYLCVIIMTAFMLMGTKAGKWITALCILDVVYFYIASEYLNTTSYDLFNNDPSLIYQDALTTFILALFLVAAQSNYLNSGKNVIIERITEQKNQLEINNRKLQEYTTHLERTNRELDKFASIVSHDLKAPLRAIGNLTGWIEEDAGDTMQGDVRANFNLIKQRVKRMEDLINAILDYSRADKLSDDETTVDTKELVEEALDFIGRPDNLTFHISPDMPVLETDKTRLAQVFSNLVGNAIKYNDKKDIIVDVRVAAKEEGWEFTVKDNGPGIEAQYHEKIFIIFQTLNRRDDVESTGVGLAIVKKIIEDQGGKIWVESEPGHGSEFKFIWPRIKKVKDSALIAAPIIV